MKLKNLVIYGSLFALGLSPIVGCSKKDSHNKNGNNASIDAAVNNSEEFDPATKMTIAAQTINDSKIIGATFTSSDDATARARIGGTLVRLVVDEGSYVTQGQVIGIIDEARYSAEVAAGQANAQAGIANARQAPAQLDAARAMANKAAADYNRTKTLYDQGVYAKARLDQMQAANAAANAQVRAAEAVAAAANANAQAAQSQSQIAIAIRAQGKILAPRSGIVTSAPIPQGSVVMPGEVVAYIAAGSPILRLNVPERDAVALKIGQSLQLTDDAGSINGVGTITKIYPSIANGQAVFDITTDTKDKFVGARANIIVPLAQKTSVVIPQSYIISRQGSEYVRLLKDNKPLEVPIQRGINTKTENINAAVEILSGLENGDIIVAPNGVKP